MKAVQNDPDRPVVHSPNDFPGIAIVIDVTSPRQRFESDPKISGTSPLAQFSKIVGCTVYSAEGSRGDVAAHKQKVGAKLLHEVEFLFDPAKGLGAQRPWHAFEVAKRLKGTNLEVEIAAHAGDVSRRAVVTGEVAFENLHSVKAGGSDGPELLAEGATN